ncbi:MAG: gamma-glutamylcyclotransferase family protein [Paracoccaceae bacterium]|nr:gamma-glutamylcyclotransferase family protein [Paracoccaceae bacterium]
MNRHFFGYGSLVNRTTHDFPGAVPARLQGWRRVWVQTPARDLAYLSVRPDPGTVIDGLVAEVPGGDWTALDLREAAYQRNPVLTEPLRGAPLVAQVYAVPDPAAHGSAKAILLSYLDTVVQGFLCEFGAEGAARFFATTDGWAAPVLNDRADPRYPRVQPLSAVTRDCVDAALGRFGHRI